MAKHIFFENKTDTTAGTVHNYYGGKATIVTVGTIAGATSLIGEISPDGGVTYAPLKDINGVAVAFDTIPGPEMFDIDVQSDSADPLKIRIRPATVASSTISSYLFTDDTDRR